MTHVSSAVRRRLGLLGSFAVIAAVSLATGASAVAAEHGVHHRAAGDRHAVQTHHARPHHDSRSEISATSWGTVGGKQVNLYTLTNGKGMKVNISNYGGVVQSIWVPNREGKLVNVALGFPTLADYVSDFTRGGDLHPVAGLGRLRRHVLRRHHRPLREPHRERHIQPQQRHLQARCQQRPELPPWWLSRLEHGRLGRA